MCLPVGHKAFIKYDWQRRKLIPIPSYSFVAEADAAHDENNHFSCVNVRNYATPSLAAAVDSFLLFLVLSL